MADYMRQHVRDLEDLGMGDVAQAGGKNASLGEMLGSLAEEGVRVPGGFAVLASGYRLLLEEGGLKDRINEQLDAYKSGEQNLATTGRRIRYMLRNAPLPDELWQEITEAYRELCEEHEVEDVGVAVRSSATAEDLPDASFAGQQETYLNIQGEGDLLEACSRCYASLFTDRAISYREEQGFDHMDVALSIGVQLMLRADTGGSGVMFSMDTESGFDKAVFITAAWGIGENVVQGSVDPDEYYVFKPALENPSLKPILSRSLGRKEIKMVFSGRTGQHTLKNLDTTQVERDRFVLEDDEIIQLAKWAVIIEKHYARPMDIEFVKDGEDGQLYVVQARPETVQSQAGTSHFKNYTLKETGELLATGRSIGQSIVTGDACVVQGPHDIEKFREGSILVAPTTDPDWVPIMRKAAGIITDHGGRTCHAAIVSRELGIPAIVGTGDGTGVLKEGEDVTLSCAQGETGYVYRGILPFESEDLSYEDLPETRTALMVNVAEPEGVFRWHSLPNDGVGLARIEFIINNSVRAHPMALIRYDQVDDRGERARLDDLTRGYPSREEYFIETLTSGVASIAATFYPNPVIVRMSDFKTNEYAELIGGRYFEPLEHNPMMGWRGASRYYSDAYREGFKLECEAMRRAREHVGLSNIKLMIPFCRTPEEADRVLEVMAECGLKRGEKGLEIYVMAELPSNVVLADEFARRFDGFSIGSNDLTQLTLGIDRDSEMLAHLFDERNDAVKRLIEQLIDVAHASGKKVGLCGQGPSDYPEFAEFLVRCGIDSISLNPDSVIQTRKIVAEVESQMYGQGAPRGSAVGVDAATGDG